MGPPRPRKLLVDGYGPVDLPRPAGLGGEVRDPAGTATPCAPPPHAAAASRPSRARAARSRSGPGWWDCRASRRGSMQMARIVMVPGGRPSSTSTTGRPSPTTSGGSAVAAQLAGSGSKAPVTEVHSTRSGQVTSWKAPASALLRRSGSGGPLAAAVRTLVVCWKSAADSHEGCGRLFAPGLHTPSGDITHPRARGKSPKTL